MKISKEHLLKMANELNYDAFTLEKVILLIDLLNQITEHYYLKDKLVLKGGTALNLFHFDLPRLSVDLDFNYIGSVDVNVMKTDREHIEQAITAICEREGYSIRRMPTEHAGGKFIAGYNSALGSRGNLALDLNFMFRVPLWPIVKKHSHHLKPFTAENILTLDIHELAAGKLAALLARCASRDLFDVYHLLTLQSLNMEKLRLAFVVYGGIDRKDWRTVTKNDVQFELNELKAKLLPVMQQNALASINSHEHWASDMMKTCQTALSGLLPFNENELLFLNKLIDEGEIIPSLLTSDKILLERIASNPGLLWKAHNVKKYKEKSSLKQEVSK